MFTLRNFAPNDLPRIMYIVAESFNQDYDPGFYLSLHCYWPQAFIVAKKEDELIGFLLGSITDEEEARILIMAVDKRHRVKGIGTALLREFMSRCSLRGLKRIALEVRISNIMAQKFYTRFGFEITHKLPRYHLDGEDAHKMVKWL
jgi:ribosomal-protein-alanine N-acetyltransferase